LSDFYYKLKGIYVGIRNIISYIPILFSDRDYDWYFLIAILKFKLTRMEKLHREEGHGLYSHRVAKKINTCRILCGRIMKDSYTTLDQLNHEKIYGEIRMVSFPIEGSTNRKLHFKYSKVDTEEETEIASAKMIDIAKRNDDLRKKDIDYLFNTIKKDITKWWD